MEMMAVIIQGVTVAMLAGAGKLMLETWRLVGVHEEKHRRHDARLEALELQRRPMR